MNTAGETLTSPKKSAQSLIENHAEDITPHILQFQQNHANVWHRQQTMSVQTSNQQHMRLLQTVYARSGLADPPPHSTSTSQSGQDPSYRQLGFSCEIPALEEDFANVGLFGLYTLYYLSVNRPEELAAVRLELHQGREMYADLSFVAYKGAGESPWCETLSDRASLSGGQPPSRRAIRLCRVLGIHFVPAFPP